MQPEPFEEFPAVALALALALGPVSEPAWGQVLEVEPASVLAPVRYRQEAWIEGCQALPFFRISGRLLCHRD